MTENLSDLVRITFLVFYIFGLIAWVLLFEKIEPPQVRRIITALDEKCRDVEF
jgi:hypothetical protein